MADVCFIAGILILIGILMSLLMFLIKSYKYFIRTGLDVNFVMLNDADCCNGNVKVVKECKSKYCMVKLMSKIVDKINRAQNSLDIAMYNLTNYELIDCILHANDRGIVIRVVADRSMFESLDSHSRIAELIKAGKSKRISNFLFKCLTDFRFD